MKAVKRKSNMELLRIVSILLIIAFHYVYKGGFNFGNYLSLNKLIVKIFWMFGELGVNLFILITGYFMINGQFKLNKLITLIGQVLFYYLLTVFFAIKIGFYEISSLKELFLTFFPITLNKYWFITAYIIIYILSPYFNTLAKSMTKSTYKKFLLILLFLYSFIPTFFGVFYNTTESLLYYNRLIWLIIIYFIGGYIKLYSLPIIKEKKKAIILSTISFSILILSILIIEKFDYYFSIIGIKDVAYFWTPNNIPMVLLSLGVFGIFLNLKVPNNNIINKVATTTLGIYLLHDGVLAYWFWNDVFKNASHQNSPILILYILGTSMIIFTLGMLIDLFRQLIEKHTIKKILDSITFKKIIKKIKNDIVKILKIGDEQDVK